MSSILEDGKFPFGDVANRCCALTFSEFEKIYKKVKFGITIDKYFELIKKYRGRDVTNIIRVETAIGECVNFLLMRFTEKEVSEIYGLPLRDVKKWKRDNISYKTLIRCLIINIMLDKEKTTEEKISEYLNEYRISREDFDRYRELFKEFGIIEIKDLDKYTLFVDLAFDFKLTAKEFIDLYKRITIEKHAPHESVEGTRNIYPTDKILRLHTFKYVFSICVQILIEKGFLVEDISEIFNLPVEEIILLAQDKYTIKDIYEDKIRKLDKIGKLSLKEIADVFDLTVSKIESIVNRKSKLKSLAQIAKKEK